MTPMLSEFSEGRPELRTPTTNDSETKACPRCEVPLDDFDIGYVEVPTDVFEFDVLADVCKRFEVDVVRTRGWVCTAHDRDVHLLRTVPTLAADGWDEFFGVEIRLDSGETTIVPVRYDAVPRALGAKISEVLGDAE